MAFVETKEREGEAVEQSVLDIVWYMKGGITLNEAWNMPHSERMKVIDLIKQDAEQTKKANQKFTPPR